MPLSRERHLNELTVLQRVRQSFNGMISFDGIRPYPARKQLMPAEGAAPFVARTFMLLLALVEQPGELVSKGSTDLARMARSGVATKIPTAFSGNTFRE